MIIHHITPKKRTHENGRGHGGPGAGPTRREQARRHRGADGGPPEKDSGPKWDATALPDRARLRPERYNQHYRTPIMTTIIEKRGPLRSAQGRGNGMKAIMTEPRSHKARRRAVPDTKWPGRASRSRPNRRRTRERSERIEPTSTQRALASVASARARRGAVSGEGMKKGGTMEEWRTKAEVLCQFPEETTEGN